ncbi:MAG: SEC-C metal-binding domain-containing protein, partial [Thiohalomonadaceae bacterium]
ETLRQRILDEMVKVAKAKEEMAGAAVMRHFEKAVMLQVLDSLWKEHLAAMDYLRQGIHLRGYAQKNPKQEYKREAFALFQQLLERIKHDVVAITSRVQVRAPEDVNAVEEQRRAAPAAVRYEHASAASYAATADAEAVEEAPAMAAAAQQPFVRETRKVGRNEPCPCGSGKKYKQCHGRLD